MKKLLSIEGLKEGIFKNRPNRYLAEVEIDGQVELVHVHDPGRLKELLYLNNKCLVKYAASDKRKTQWDMIAAQKEGDFVLIHSGYHRYIAEAILKDEMLNPFGAIRDLKAEVKHEDSRIDFTFEDSDGNRTWVEVKGCSLSEAGVAKFPDAPTVRGRKHLNSLMDLKQLGDRVGVLLLVLSESEVFAPKADTDPEFAKTFYDALDAGVEIYPVKVLYDALEGAMVFNGQMPILPKT